MSNRHYYLNRARRAITCEHTHSNGDMTITHAVLNEDQWNRLLAMCHGWYHPAITRQDADAFVQHVLALSFDHHYE